MSLSVFQIEDYKPYISSMIKSLLVGFSKCFYSSKNPDILVLEYWIDRVWEMDFLLSVAAPDISIITKIDKVHFGNPDITAQEKFKLSYGTKQLCFLNNDDPYCRQAKNNITVDVLMYSNEEYVDYGLGIPLVYANNFDLSQKGEKFFSTYDIYVDQKSFNHVQSTMLGRENAWYAAVGWAILDVLYKKYYQKSFIEENPKGTLDLHIPLQPWRFSIFHGLNESIIIDSSYNAAPLSMRKVMDNTMMFQRQYFPDRHIIFCLWDMRELWDLAISEHKKLAWYVSQMADRVFLVWENMRVFFYDELLKIGYPKDQVSVYENSIQLWEALKDYLNIIPAKSLILFKWSQNTIFLEEAIKQVLLHPEDTNHLCRQADFWGARKSI